jgi:D-threo-aldose 1-dehydrogenase
MTNFSEECITSKPSPKIELPAVIFGTSSLGNLFVSLDENVKCGLIREYVQNADGQVVFDSAGKYGAGLALEMLGKCLRQLNVPPQKVVISNKLGWLRTPLTTEEPTFEPGVWKALQYDAVQKISYEGILECFEQGNELLGGYTPQMVSVHDPDEYLAAAKDEQDEQRRYADIMAAYEALYDLKQQGKVKAVGVGAKDWKIIRRIANDLTLDWMMIANSMTVKNHPSKLIDFIAEMESKGVYVINSAVFNSGFLVGGDYFDYQPVLENTPQGMALYQWRAAFFETCKQYDVKPAEACVQFALHVPGVRSIALNTSEIERVKENLEMVHVKIPSAFWQAMQAKGLITFNLFSNSSITSLSLPV